jgi:hypothetical protein
MLQLLVFTAQRLQLLVLLHVQQPQVSGDASLTGPQGLQGIGKSFSGLLP